MSSKFFGEFRASLITVLILTVTSQIAHAEPFSYNALLRQQAIAQLNFNPTPIFREEPTFQERDIFILVNYRRKQSKLRALKWHYKLAKLARFYSRKMADDDFFEHTDRDGKSIADRAKDFKIRRWRKIGENLFFSKGLISPSVDAVESWMDSPGHRLNMLDDDWTHTAIGVYEKSGMVTYITQVFLEK